MPKLMVEMMPPVPAHPGDPASLASFTEAVQRGVCEVFVQLENEWIKASRRDGTTVTAALVYPGHGLLTVANVGDSRAVLDTGCSILGLTSDHRINNSPVELKRLKNAGCVLAQLAMDLQGERREEGGHGKKAVHSAHARTPLCMPTPCMHKHNMHAHTCNAASILHAGVHHAPCVHQHTTNPY